MLFSFLPCRSHETSSKTKLSGGYIVTVLQKLLTIRM